MIPNKRILKAYVRIDGQGNVVKSSLVLRPKMPKNGRWIEIPANECCNPTTTTTSTTTVAVTTTTTSSSSTSTTTTTTTGIG